MQGEFDVAYRATRRRYELGRLLAAFQSAAVVTLAVALVSGIVIGRRALVWVPVTFVTVAFTEWRGVLLMKGARRGVIAGLGSMLLPLSILRPCCGVDAKAMGESCCTMPSACWASGAVVGLVMALVLPKAPEGRRTEAAAGVILGVTSVAVLRCSALFAGEAVGLLGGIAAAVAATSLARAWLSRGRSAA
jgi:hypothetical protein